MSQVDKFKAYVELHNTVDATGALAGRSIGLRDNEGTSMSYLVTRKNSRTVGVEGDWRTSRASWRLSMARAARLLVFMAASLTLSARQGGVHAGPRAGDQWTRLAAVSR